jgi:molecular chaperone DnaK
VFSTAAPYQTSVDIHVLQGERPMASDNKTIGKFKLKGIKKAPAGVPQIEVTFDIDTNGILTVSAKDLDTGKEQSITITANEKMSDFEIEQAIKDAELYASQDQTRREALAVTSEAEKLLAATEQALSKCGKQLEKAEKKQVKSDISALRKLLFKSKPTNLSEGDILNIRSAMNVLESSGNHVRTLAGND